MRSWASASLSVASASPRRPGQPVDQRPMASMARRAVVEVGILLAEVDGRQLVEAHGVVGHDHVGRGLQHPLAGGGHLGGHGFGLGPLLVAEAGQGIGLGVQAWGGGV